MPRGILQVGFDNLFFDDEKSWELFEEQFNLQYVDEPERQHPDYPKFDYDVHIWRMKLGTPRHELLIAQCMPCHPSWTLGHVRIQGSHAIVSAAWLFLQHNSRFKNDCFGRADFI